MFQTAAGMPVLPIVNVILGVSALAALALFFKPLLSGIVRAAVLVVRPRLTRDELSARRRLRDTKLMQKTINSAHGVTQTAELHSIAARG